jgi:uncharacterized protein
MKFILTLKEMAMSMGLIALLDDVAAIAKMAAASLDDVTAQATKAGSKAAAVVIDDAAVTPGYVVGFNADRELPIILKIAKASLKNKLIILLPIIITLGYFAPWIITPILMIGGIYLCYEGAEKIYESILPHNAHEHEAVVIESTMTPQMQENKTVVSAIRTDFILSAEIMAISFSGIVDASVWKQILILIIIGIILTIAVYGVVAIVVKMDDVGLMLARNNLKKPTAHNALKGFGKLLVLAMPMILFGLTIIGTAAMTWVGGSIIAHGLVSFGISLPEDTIHHAVDAVKNVAPSALLEWLTSTLLQFVFGLICGALTIPLVQFVIAPLIKKIAR